MISKIASHYRKSFEGLPAAIWAMSFVLFVHRCGTMVLPFLSLHLKDHLGLSATTAALLLSCYGLGSLGGSFLGGYLIGRVGAVRVMLLSLIATAPLFIGLLYADTLVTAAIAIFSISLIADCVRPAAMTATADFCSSRELSRAYALNRLAVNLGMSIGPALAGLLYLNYFAWIFYIDALTCLAAAALVLRLFGWNNREPIASGEDSTANSTFPSKLMHDHRTESVWKDRQLISVLGLTFLTIIIFLQMISVYPIYLREQCQISEATIGIMFSINTLIIVLFEMVLITAIDHLPKLTVIGIGCVLITLGFGMLPFGSSLMFICATVVIWTSGEMLAMPLLSTWVGQRAPAAKRGSYMGAVTATFSLAWIVAPLIGGALYAIQPSAIWYVSLGISPVVAIGFWRLARRESIATLNVTATRAVCS